jgi:hypothetical protein
MEQRAVVRFLTLKKLSAKDITAELEGVDGHEALCLSAVRKWRKRLANGIITLEDDPRSVRPSQSDLSGSVHAHIEESPVILCKRVCQKLRIAKKLAYAFCMKLLGSDSIICSGFRMY